MYRIKYLLGSMAVIFSMVYGLFGVTSWLSADASYKDVLVCFVLTAIHFVAGAVLLLLSVQDYRREKYIIDSAFKNILSKRGGRVTVAELADAASVSADDAREYLMRRSSEAPTFYNLEGESHESYTFGHRFQNN